MKPEWMPENPFWNEPILGADKTLGIGFDYGMKTGAKAVLEYLLKLQGTGAGDDPRYADHLSKAFIRQMLKEIE